MKKLSMLLLFLSLATLTAFAASSENRYGEYNTFDDLHVAYNEAVLSGDLEKQKELYAIATRTLQEDISQSEEITPRYNPSESDWIALFPTYFKRGQFAYRWYDSGPNGNGQNAVNLELTPTSKRVWSSVEKKEGWNSTYAKFYKSPHWDNYDIMKEQFYCHAHLGYSHLQDVWNLEPWKTEINAFTCN